MLFFHLCVCLPQDKKEIPSPENIIQSQSLSKHNNKKILVWGEWDSNFNTWEAPQTVRWQGNHREVVKMDSRLSASEACRETRHSFTCCCLPLTCISQWFVTEPSKLLVCMDQLVRNVGSEGRSNDALHKIYTMVIHSLSIRRGCCGCVMKTNGDVAVLQQLCMQPHPSPSEWDLLAITGRGRRGSLTCHCSYTSTSGSCSCSVNLKRLC